MTEFEGTERILPGLEPPTPRESQLVRSVRSTITALNAEGLLLSRHAMVCQLMLDMAEVVDAGRRQGRASAAAMAAAQLLAAYVLLLPETTEGGEDDAWSELVADLRRSATAVRNEAESAAPD